VSQDPQPASHGRQDIDGALNGWEFKPGMMQARLVDAGDGRQVIQMRVDLGVLQLEMTGRPDGKKPHGHETFFAYLKHIAKQAERSGHGFQLTENQCMEADREFFQFYHRRICWLILSDYTRAVADADHTLAFMDFVRDHSPSEEYTEVHERHRAFVLFHRTQAAAARAAEGNDPEEAIDQINEGLKSIRECYASRDAEDHMEEDGMVQQLRTMEDTLREKHNIEATLREQLDKAVANEEYETAARLRDALKRKR
jgi:hypothetical protein